MYFHLPRHFCQNYYQIIKLSFFGTLDWDGQKSWESKTRDYLYRLITFFCIIIFIVIIVKIIIILSFFGILHWDDLWKMRNLIIPYSKDLISDYFENLALYVCSLISHQRNNGMPPSFRLTTSKTSNQLGARPDLKWWQSCSNRIYK